MKNDKREPAIQNIPLRTEEGRALRDAFVADFARRFGFVDYAALEKLISENLTEWQCDECAHVNEKLAVVCSDCGTLRPS